MPQISVVIPTYNAGKWVEATLNSVVKQSLPHENFEIIVVDDGSKDDSPRIAREFLQRWPGRHQVVLRDKNGGIGAARNTGWRAASGEWIQFLDADDLLTRPKLELQGQVASTAPPEVAVVYSNWQYLELTDGEWRPSGPLHAPFVDDDPVVRILEEFDFGYVGPTIVRRSSVELVGGFTEKPNIGEDCDLMMRIAVAGGRFREARSASAAFLYRQTPGSAWRRSIHNVDAMRNMLLGFRHAEEVLRKRNAGELSAREREAFAKRYGRFPEHYLESDPRTFEELMGWLQGLGYDQPPNLTPRVRALSSVLGYKNTLKLRSGFFKQRWRLKRSYERLMNRARDEEGRS